MDHYSITLPVLLIGMLVALAAMPLNVWRVNTRGNGTEHARGWRKRLGAFANARPAMSALTLLLVAAAVAAVGWAWWHHADQAGMLQAVVLASPLATLRQELNEAKDRAATLMKAALEEKRVLTDEERAKVEEHLAAAREAKAKIERAEGDEAFRARLAELNEFAGKRTAGEAKANDAVAKPEKPKSLGEQFIESAAYDFIRKGNHRGGSAWRTPAVELAATLTSDAASGGDLIVPEYRPGIVPLLFRRLTVADLIAPGTTDSNAVTYMKETTFTNAAAAVAEGATKPESTIIFDAVTDMVRKIAHWLPVTDEMLEDVAGLRSYIDQRLILGVQLAEETQLLSGNGTAPNIQGVLNRTGLQSAQARGSDSNADAIFKQMMTIMTNAFVLPDGIVIHPTNWQTIVLSKDANGHYFNAGPFNAPPTPSLWGVPCAVTPAITANTALPGAFRQCAQFFRKGGIMVEASNSHADFFTQNLTAIRAEERGALAVYRPGGFGTVTGLN